MYDVAVIGAGLAGLHLSRLLASRGLRVLLADRKASVADGVHTTGIFVRKTWEDFPLPGEQLGAPIRHVTLYSPSRRPFHLVAGQDEFRVGRMSWLYLYLLEQCSRAGVTWMPSAEFVAFDGSALTLRRNRREQTCAVRYLAGADGARSAVARCLSLDRNSEFLVGLEDVVESAGGEPALHCYLHPRLAPGYIAWVVDDGSEAHVGLAGYRERFDPAQALRTFRQSLPFANARTIERRGGLIPVNGILGRIANQRGLLAGDAAGAVSPLTAGGLDAAIRLSTFAAEVIAAYLDSGDARVLAQYTGARFGARFIARRWMRRAIATIRSPAIIELGCSMLRLQPFRAIAEHVFFGRGSFPDARLDPTGVTA
ncbi:MAG TPA: NAD(P)/FAD-dependent oxidoreductase [Thermoanaerobaculia bacterium]|nr:NAD(P)/FAD-dependent oxidoreductase [Thermoanaerobaculia bacterium]